MPAWLLQSVEIEGFRGINNQGAPLVLKFKPNCVTSISAQNGVGKSSIFDAISFAIRGRIPKLDGLPASEYGTTYYVNRFHTLGQGHVTLTLAPENGGNAISIRVDCGADGNRTITGPTGVDADVMLQQLDRDFVLLDNKTFQSFIDTKDLDRGRSFAGLLGLKRYSELRQTLQALSRTQSFNNHFQALALEQRRRTATSNALAADQAAQTAFEKLTSKDLKGAPTRAEAETSAHSSIEQIAILKDQCTGKKFPEIDFQACLDSIKQVEGGEERKHLARLIRKQEHIEGLLNADTLSLEGKNSLRELAEKREQGIQNVGSELLHNHFLAAESVLTDGAWADKNLCPTCDTKNETSVLEKVQKSLTQYQAVHDLGEKILEEWNSQNWDNLVTLEQAAAIEGEDLPIGDIAGRIDDSSLNTQQVDLIWARRQTYRERLASRLTELQTERLALEQKLPPSLVEVTTKVEAARALAAAWKSEDAASSEQTIIAADKARIDKIKRFLEAAAATFAGAESRAANRRLTAVKPVCRDFFSGIVFVPIEPALIKRAGGEEIALQLEKFWGLQDLSAQALLSESFRNAFAVSVFLAAAKLYGGDAKFIVLDDITSSFDAGHQYHIMEIIRTKFARPAQAQGPQVIILSHDTLLEKLFNKNGNGPDWQHIRLEGTAQTSVLQQSGGGNHVRAAAVSHLNAGQVQDGAFRLRPYLEFKLLEIIDRVNIPVPIDFAIDDNSKQVQRAIDAIKAAVALYKAANQLILTPQQEAGLQTNLTTITGNFLSHYATGSTQAFSAPSLLGVITAIDAYAECFMYEDPPGSGNKKYYRSLAHK